ncbi:type IV secretory system conjugative DNA transfer family protein [Bacillus hominis]|uniref:type IV secretory system conjugative DNA transfer family protein n=1 Tax=Bacillus hominis TaxID=2817478 RepID=UPI001BB43439|nr:type IV secretion system DNA-binding domain-containing protein [Bacillus hominis]
MSYLQNEVMDGQRLGALHAGEVRWKGTANIGIRGLNNTGLVIHEQLLARHILCLGSIGSGKSVTMYHIVNAIRKKATDNDVFVFFDAKGDYLKEFYESGDYVISNQGEELDGTVYWNIYRDILQIIPKKRDEAIREIATVLFKEDIKNSSSPIFATGARDLFAAILTCQVRNIEENQEEWDHSKLVEWLKQATDITIRNLLKPYEDLKWVRNYINKDNSASTNQSYIVHLYQNLFNVFSGGFAQAGDFSIKEALRNKGGKAIFLEYDLENGNVLKPVYTLMLDLAMKDVLGRSTSEGNVYFILDEFPLIPKLSYMDNALNFGRSLGVKVIAGIQNVGQVEYVYDQALARSIISGFGTVFAFRLFDEESRNVVATRHGRTKKIVSIVSSNANKGVQDLVIDGSAIEDWDLVNLKIGQCIVSPFNGEPFLFYPINYIEREYK